MKKKVVSLFSGAGGLDLGLEAAGFETVLATDIDEHSCKALEANKVTAYQRQRPFLSNAKILCKDVTELSGGEILKAANLKEGELDLLSGGPPCQAFSVFGKRKGRQDPRGRLVYHYLRLIEQLKPKAFVFENVYGILTAEGGAAFDEIKKLLTNPAKNLKYKLSIHRLNAVDYGVPQFRDRVFIIGCREGRSVEEILPICADQKDLITDLIPRRTAEDGLRGLPPIGDEESHNHTGRKHSQRIIDRYTQMSFGERDHFTRINKLDPSRPSFTIIVGSDAGGGKGHIHPHEGREVTPRESARMQCFPDWWWFSGTSRHPIRQVGNAVPTLLGLSLGRHLLHDIFEVIPNGLVDGINMLDQQHLFTAKEIRFLRETDHLNQQERLAPSMQ